MKHIRYPEIGQFRNAIHQVTCAARKTGEDAHGDPIYDHAKTLPTLTYEGTVKLHGTNAAIGLDRTTGEFWFQSRDSILTTGADNEGFFRYFQDKPYSQLFTVDGTVIVIFGEWCGGNIQSTVALAKLSKRFVIFGIQADGKWLGKDIVKEIKSEEIGVYNIHDYPSFGIDIDFNRPELSQNKLAELTTEVEKTCPFAAKHGVVGTGEGIVWKSVAPGWESPDFFFKVKGKEHSVSKVKTLAAVNVELVESMREFAENTVTENRCRQGISKLKETGSKVDKTSLGQFLKWIVADIEKEESDTAKASNIDLKKAAGELTKAAKLWFFKNESTF